VKICLPHCVLNNNHESIQYFSVFGIYYVKIFLSGESNTSTPPNA